MLSILIPTYNYKCYDLVVELKKQCDLVPIEYEIIVLDDASALQIQENLAINTLENCSYQSNSSNLGRANNINKLINLSNFNYCLILDCDVFPKNDSFISNYLTEINSEKSIVFGGIDYQPKTPSPNEMLRWKYGINREAVSVEKRKKNPYNNLLTSNILISKKIFKTHLFHTEIIEYGYEDLVFAKKLEHEKIPIKNIENEVFHLNLETSVEFLQKTERALNNLFFLETTGILSVQSTKVTKLHNKVKQLHLNKLFGTLFSLTSSILKQNLCSKNPNLVIFDLYKILYYCNISK